MQLSRNRIDLLMAKQRITADELAKKYGASRSRIQTIFNSANVTPRTVGKLAAALGVDPEDIIVKEQRGNAQGNSTN